MTIIGSKIINIQQVESGFSFFSQMMTNIIKYYLKLTLFICVLFFFLFSNNSSQLFSQCSETAEMDPPISISVW